MGYSLELDTVNNTIRSTWEGRITDDILLEHHSTLVRLMASRSQFRGIQDFSAVTAFDASTDVIRRLAEMPLLPGLESTLVIVAPKAVIYGMSRMFSTLAERIRPDLHVVHTLDEAYGLLGIASPQFSRLEID